MKNQEKNVKKERNFFIKHIELVIGVAVLLVIGTIAYVGIFETLELASYDLLMRIKPATEERDDIVIAAIDDASIAVEGTYPWPRDIIGDAIIRMRELGAAQVVFDIEYLSPSTKGINPKAVEALPDTFNSAKDDISSYISELSSAIASGNIPLEYVADEGDYLADFNSDTLENLQNHINSEVLRDYDEYFAQALHYFGNSWLTINAGDIGIEVPETLEQYVRKNVLNLHVTEPEGLTSKENDVFLTDGGQKRKMTPAMELLMRASDGAGFTNIILDSDGVRRRIELLHESEGQYFGQLVFAPLLDTLDTNMLVRKNNKLIIKDALFPGEDERRNITIPLDSNGRMLINWIPDTFDESFKNESMSFFINLDETEDLFIESLQNISSFKLGTSDGYLSYYNIADYLLYLYDDLQATKKALLEGTSSPDTREDARYYDYIARRAEFFMMCEELTLPEYLEEIFTTLDNPTLDATEEQREIAKTNIKINFDNYKKNLTVYNDLFATGKENYDGSFVVIGHTASNSTDLGTTPFEGKYANVGTHANVYNTIMNEDFITPINPIYSFVFAIVVVFLYLLLSKKMSTKIRYLFGAILIVAVPAVSGVLIVFNYYLAFISAFLSIVIVYLGTSLWNLFSTEADKKFLRSTFGTFLSDKVVENIVASGQPPELGGEKYTITALFSDIKGFSSFSEKLTPSELVDVLNKYLSALSNEILANDGTVDKYIGDAIVAMFGAPEAMDDHAYKACVSAIKMKQAEIIVNEGLKEINKKLITDGKTPMEIKTRIGLNSGDVVAGLMGTDKMKNYTMMGDNVNLAARLESGVKKYEEWIMISENTWEAANSGENEGKLVVRRLDKVRVVGRSTPVQLFNLIGFKEELSKETLEMIDIFEEALDLCNASILEKDKKKLGEAKQRFYDALAINPEDGPTKVFIARCDDFITKGFPKDWDGVINWTSK